MSLGSERIRHIFGYHPGTTVTVPLHEKTREGFISLAEYLDQVLGPCDPDAVKMVMKKLQEAVMWANFAVAQLAPVEEKRDRLIPTPADIHQIPPGDLVMRNPSQ